LNQKPFEITRDEFIEWYNAQEKVCVYCDILEKDLELWIDNYNPHAQRLAIDCKDNDIGYTINNITLSCYICNFIKGNMFSYKEMLEIGQKHVKPKWMILKNKV